MVPCRHSTTPLLSVTVSYVVITETLFLSHPIPFIFTGDHAVSRQRVREKEPPGHTELVGRPEVNHRYIYIAIK